MGSLESFTPVKAVGAGRRAVGAQPEEPPADDRRSRCDRADRDLDRPAGREYVVFILIASIGVAAPVVLYFALGERSREMLDELKGG